MAPSSRSEVDRLGKIGAQGLEGVALADLDQVDKAAFLQVLPRPLHLGRLELAGDQAAAAIVPQGCGEMQGRDAERGPELDDRPRAAASRQHVEQRAGLAGDGEREILQAAVEVAVLGLASHQARLLFVGELAKGGAISASAASAWANSRASSGASGNVVRVDMRVSGSGFERVLAPGKKYE